MTSYAAIFDLSGHALAASPGPLPLTITAPVTPPAGTTVLLVYACNDPDRRAPVTPTGWTPQPVPRHRENDNWIYHHVTVPGDASLTVTLT